MGTKDSTWTKKTKNVLVRMIILASCKLQPHRWVEEESRNGQGKMWLCPAVVCGMQELQKE